MSTSRKPRPPKDILRDPKFQKKLAVEIKKWNKKIKKQLDDLDKAMNITGEDLAKRIKMTDPTVPAPRANELREQAIRNVAEEHDFIAPQIERFLLKRGTLQAAFLEAAVAREELLLEIENIVANSLSHERFTRLRELLSSRKGAVK